MLMLDAISRPRSALMQIIHQTSWINKRKSEGLLIAHEADLYCRMGIDLPPFPGKMEAYVIAIYITTMTLTTVGYGDISANNTPERVGYVLFFIVGAFYWGNLLAEVRLGEDWLIQRI